MPDGPALMLTAAGMFPALLDLPLVRWFRVVGGARFDAHGVRVAAEARFEELDMQLADSQEREAQLGDKVIEAERKLTACREQQRTLERQAQEATFSQRSLEARRGELSRSIETATQQATALADEQQRARDELARLSDAAAQGGLQQALEAPRFLLTGGGVILDPRFSAAERAAAAAKVDGSSVGPAVRTYLIPSCRRSRREKMRSGCSSAMRCAVATGVSARRLATLRITTHGLAEKAVEMAEAISKFQLGGGRAEPPRPRIVARR